jgi:coniferyl-aldehyde dehydrogenase
MNGPAMATIQMRLASILGRQRAAFLREGAPSLAQRRADLAKLKTAILAHRKAFEIAVDQDFGHRLAYETAIMDLVPTIQGIDYRQRHVERWMRTRRRHVALHFLPGRASVI